MTNINEDEKKDLKEKNMKGTLFDIEESDRHYDLETTVAVMGDRGVGKTCYILKYIDDTFDIELETPDPTVYSLNTLYLYYKTPKSSERKIMRLNIIDTSGSEQFEKLMHLYLQTAEHILLCYSVESPQSMYRLESVWFPKIKAINSPAKLVLVEMKADLRNTRMFMLSTQEGITAAESLEEVSGQEIIPFVETSVKDNVNIKVPMNICVTWKVEEIAKKSKKKHLIRGPFKKLLKAIFK